MKKHYILAALLLFSTSLFSQNIPDNRKVNWEIAGFEGDIPCALDLVDAVSEFGIDNSGTTDVSNAINSALLSLTDGQALYFPNGTYLLNNPVSIPANRIIRGESPELTVFHIDFSSNGTGFEIQGSATSGTETSVSYIGNFGDYDITVANTGDFMVGDDIEIYQENDPDVHGIEDAGDNTSWASNIKGQVAKIAAIDGNTITIDRSIAFDYDINFAITFRKLNLVENVGIENLKMIRISDNGTGSGNNNIWFSYVKNCWVRKVHSEYSSRYHIQVDHARNLEFTELFMDKAYSCGGGGAGYGLLMQDHVSESLVENSLAKTLRHPWIIKEGCVRNVYAYNFSAETTQGDACDADPLTDSYADISLHGHWPAYNLFEGNIVYRITSSDAWGPNGPGNTFLRNRVLGVKGIWIQSYSKTQNVIGNELTHADAQFEMDKDNTLDGTTLHYSNYGINGLLDTDAPNTVSSSLYLSAKPSFFGDLTWPSIGPGTSFNSGEIPAQIRYNSGNYFSDALVCAACSQPQLGDDLSLCGKTSIDLSTNIPNTSGYTFEWTKDGNTVSDQEDITIDQAGVYIILTDSSGCNGQDQIEIFDELPLLDLGNDIELCDPATATLQSNITDPSFDYEWSMNDTQLSNNPTLKTSKSGIYKLTVQANGCDAVTDEIEITSLLLDVSDVILCQEGMATLEVSESGNYNWFDENMLAAGQGQSIDVSISESTTYFVEDANGFSGLVGMSSPTFSDNKAWTDSRFERKMTFTVEQKVTIDSISVWSAGASTIILRVLASDNSTEVFTKTVTGVTQDTEIRIAIHEELQPGNYYLDFEGTNGDLYYSNENDLGIAFPYAIDDLITLTGSEPSWINAKPYYMFAYNWRVSAGNPCAATPVVVTLAPSDPSCSVTSKTKSVENISISPNPSHGLVHFNVPSKWVLLNPTGNVLERGEGNSIDLSRYDHGIYFLKVNDKTFKLMKE